MADDIGRGPPGGLPLARRGFIMTGLIVGFSPAAGAAQPTAIHTDTAGLAAGDVEIAVPDGKLPAYFARPAGRGPFPIILVVEEIYGVHEYMADVCRRLAKLGYLAVAPELYARQGDLSKMTDPKAIVRDVISKAPDAQVMADLDAAAAWAAANHGDAHRLGITGFCWGGRDVWLYAAHNPALRAAVAWYGPLHTPTSPIQPRTALDVAAEIKCPLLELSGDQDPSVTVSDVREAQQRARAAGKTVEIVVYPHTGHAFHADYRETYREVPARDGWKRMLAWFHKYGVAPSRTG